ncbi:MAG: LCP family protein [Chloroflexi bacterium]|nr:LCP family protein [Chloroflexota bacterium]
MGVRVLRRIGQAALTGAVIIAGLVLGLVVVWLLTNGAMASPSVQQPPRLSSAPPGAGGVPVAATPRPKVAPTPGGQSGAEATPGPPESLAGRLIAPWTGNRRVTFVILGLDQRGNQVARADVIMLASIDPLTKRAVLLSIPRDLWVPIPGHGTDRINAAYAFGSAQGPANGGAKLTIKTIEQNFQVQIDHYVATDFRCFAQVVDVIGGVTIDVPQPITDTHFGEDQEGRPRVLHFDAGSQLMDGKRALEYVRTRHADSDFGRITRQQAVLLAIFDKKLTPDEIIQIPKLAESACLGLKTDLSTVELMRFALYLRNIPRDQIVTKVIDRSLISPYVTEGGAEVLLPAMDRLRPTVRRMFGGS